MEVLYDIIVNHENRVQVRREQMVHRRLLRDQSEPDNIGPEIFYAHYRMYPPLANFLVDLLTPFLPNDPNGLSPKLQVYTILRYLAEGHYQKGVGADYRHPISQPTVSKYMHIVVPAINRLAPYFIAFPKTYQERHEIQRKFYTEIGIPNVLGAVDGTLPKIVAPNENEEAYLNYEQDHSLNVQMVSDYDKIVRDIRICSGCTNDKFMWRHSEVREYMYSLRLNEEIAANEGHYYLIADGGYDPSPVLLTPIQGTLPGTPERAYTDRLCRSRVRIENTFGIIKSKWRCLNKLRGLHYDPIFAAEIVLACTVLHNFVRRDGVPFLGVINDIPNLVQNVDNLNMNEYDLGLAERLNVINANFN